jgi:hypothetical protein
MGLSLTLLNLASEASTKRPQYNISISIANSLKTLHELISESESVFNWGFGDLKFDRHYPAAPEVPSKTASNAFNAPKAPRSAPNPNCAESAMSALTRNSVKRKRSADIEEGPKPRKAPNLVSVKSTAPPPIPQLICL